MKRSIFALLIALTVSVTAMSFNSKGKSYAVAAPFCLNYLYSSQASQISCAAWASAMRTAFIMAGYPEPLTTEEPLMDEGGNVIGGMVCVYPN